MYAAASWYGRALSSRGASRVQMRSRWLVRHPATLAGRRELSAAVPWADGGAAVGCAGPRWPPTARGWMISASPCRTPALRSCETSPRASSSARVQSNASCWMPGLSLPGCGGLRFRVLSLHLRASLAGQYSALTGGGALKLWTSRAAAFSRCLFWLDRRVGSIASPSTSPPTVDLSARL